MPTTIILDCDHEAARIVVNEKFGAPIVDALGRVGDPPQHSPT
ncbi:hypothetical protein [Cryobacterium sp. Hb1]|nr:hypothetical protein [Cryobacterium sp. Hb1]